jgi:hypothetical protein
VLSLQDGSVRGGHFLFSAANGQACGGRASEFAVSQFGLGRLPGDIVIERENMTLHFPLATCLLISLLLSVALWVAKR